MPAKNHKTLDKNDQISMRFTPYAYTKENMERKETT